MLLLPYLESRLYASTQGVVMDLMYPYYSALNLSYGQNPIP